MRIWSLHPKYLDQKGLVALWRETLLAQKVLQGKTKGYRNHPQLIRFKKMKKPLDYIGFYLKVIWQESVKRGYRFREAKIYRKPKRKPKPIPVTSGQLEYERKHLLKKLKIRDRKKLEEVKSLKRIVTHPGFRVIKGRIAEWEKI